MANWTLAGKCNSQVMHGSSHIWIVLIGSEYQNYSRTFWYLEIDIFWFKKDSCTEFKNGLTKKKPRVGEFANWDLSKINIQSSTTISIFDAN